MDSHRIDLRKGLHEFNIEELNEIKEEYLDSKKNENNTDGYVKELLIQINRELENRAS